jgi:hypothetical protein
VNYADNRYLVEDEIGRVTELGISAAISLVAHGVGVALNLRCECIDTQPGCTWSGTNMCAKER